MEVLFLSQERFLFQILAISLPDPSGKAGEMCAIHCILKKMMNRLFFSAQMTVDKFSNLSLHLQAMFFLSGGQSGAM